MHTQYCATQSPYSMLRLLLHRSISLAVGRWLFVGYPSYALKLWNTNSFILDCAEDRKSGTHGKQSQAETVLISSLAYSRETMGTSYCCGFWMTQKIWNSLFLNMQASKWTEKIEQLSWDRILSLAGFAVKHFCESEFRSFLVWVSRLIYGINII